MSLRFWWEYRPNYIARKKGDSTLREVVNEQILRLLLIRKCKGCHSQKKMFDLSRLRITHLYTQYWIYHIHPLMDVQVLPQWKSASIYTSWTYSTYHLELALGTFMRHFVSACLVCYRYWENISKFVFANSRFQIAEALQSLLCDGHSAAVVNKSRTCWATIAKSSLLLWNQKVQRVTLSCSSCFTDTDTDVWIAVKW